MSFLKKLIPGHHKDTTTADGTTTGSHGSHGATTTTTTTGAVPSGAVVAEVPLTDGHHHYGPPPHNASATVSQPITGATVASGTAVDHHHHHHGHHGTATTGVVGVAPATTTTTSTRTTGEQTMILSEEKLVVGKREQEVGGVDITKHIERHTESVPVTLAREVVSVERRPIAAGSGAYAAGSASTFGQDQHITATVSAEQAVVGKTIVASEQVQVSKARVAETQVVQGQVRTENVEVKREAAAPVAAGVATGAYAQGAGGAYAGGATAAPAGAASGSIVNQSGAVTAFEEHLAVGKERVATGQVDVHKRVDVSMASAPVRLEHDEVAVTRTAVTGAVPVPASLSQGSVHIGIGRETAQVGTVVVPKEEVVIRKGVQVEQQMVTGEVLREKIAVTATGAVHVDPAAAHQHGAGVGAGAGAYAQPPVAR